MKEKSVVLPNSVSESLYTAAKRRARDTETEMSFGFELTTGEKTLTAKFSEEDSNLILFPTDRAPDKSVTIFDFNHREETAF